MSIRSRLYLLVLFALLPLVLVEVYNEVADRRASEEAVQRDARDESVRLAAEIDRLVSGIEHVLRSVTLSSVIQSDSAERCAVYLAGLRSAFNGPAGIGIADRDGNVFCLSRDMPEPLNIADRRYFRRAMAEGGFSVGEYVIGRRGGVPAIHFGLPLKARNGSVAGVAFVPLNLEWLSQQIKARPWPVGAVVRITDGNGTVIAAFPKVSESGAVLPVAWRQAGEAIGADGAGSRQVASDSQHTFASTPVSERYPDLKVWVGLSSAEARRHNDETTRRSAAWLVASVLLGLALAHLISQRYVHQPLQALEATAERLRAGDFSARAKVGDLDTSEFGRLADTFNRLSTQLQNWQAENDVVQQALRVARDDALRASQSKTSFVASVGHDLRQPLHAMAITASLLKLKLKNTPEAVIADRMGRSVSNLSDLVHALLDVSQLDAGLIEPDVSDFTVDSLLQSSTEDFADQAAAKNVRLVVEPSPESVRSDPRLLRRMVQNIVSNAVKYTPAGGTVTARAVAHDDAVEIVVSDTGPGIPAAQQQAVWEEFKQLANPERDHRKGLGLGMSIVKRMADLLGHEVTLSSASGEGTSVSIRVPRRNA